MKKKCLPLLFEMTKYSAIGFLSQLLFLSTVLATETNAQKARSVKEVYMEVGFDNVKLLEVFREIESGTSFHFTIHENERYLRERFSLPKSNISVAQLLLKISKQTRLVFQQVNNNIAVKKGKKSELRTQLPIKIFIQSMNVAGRVTSLEDGEPIPGASVIEKGTTNGTVTDKDGYYQLEVDENATLVFSSIGFVKEEVPVGNQSVIDVVMVADIQQLSEIVVIGFGEKSRKLLTESIGTLGAQEIQKVPVASPDQALQGRVSGVQVTNVDGTPGSPVAIRIRGVGTVGNTQPLFVIDGIPIGRGEGSGTNPLTTINPADIETISVLKDASAAAVYGVRAANGVVLITTKRGSMGKPTINLDGYYGIQRLPDLWDMNNTQQYIALTQDAFNAFNSQNGLDPSDPSFLELHPDLQNGSRYRDINSPWLDDAINQNAPIQNYNVSVSGATERLNYFVSGGYFSQDATADKWELDRFNFRANTEYKIGNRFKFGQNFNISYQEVFRGVNGGGDGFLLNNAATTPPFFEIFENPDFPIPGNRYGYNGNLDVAGLTLGNQNGINRIVDRLNRRTRIIGNIYAELEIIEGLRFRTSAALDLSNNKGENWQPSYTAEELGLERATNQFVDSRSENSTQVYTNTLTYERSFGDHNFNLLTGIEYQRLRGSSLSFRGQNFLSSDPDFYRIVSNGSGDPDDGFNNAEASASEGAFVGYIGRLSYNFKNKYLFTATVRRDGTSRFSPVDDRRWGTFPSFSAAWRVSEEPFFQGVPVISDLKVRGSWGQLGNDQTSAFPHVFRVSVTPDYGLNGSNTLQAPTPVNFVNESVIWETVETIDFGIDVSFWDDKLNLLATYYRRETKDFLISIPIPAITGFNSTPINAGTVLNKGIELEVGYSTRVLGDLNLDFSANFTTVDNEITALTEGVDEFLVSEGYRTAVGFPIGYLYGYQTDGLYQTDAEAANALPDNSSPNGPRAGDIRFVDNNGPAPEDAPAGQQFSGEPDGRVDFNDRTFLGKTIPDFFYGLNVGAQYKGFDLSIFFQGVSGIQLYNKFRERAESLRGGGRNQLATTNNRWTGPGTSNSMPRAVSTDPNANNRFSDRWVEDAGFFRLKNLQLGYSLPQSLLEKTKAFKSARFYVSATNLLTITDYSGLDPEVITYRSNGSQIGVEVSTGNDQGGGSGTDEGNIPQSRTYQIGFQLQF